MSKHYLSNYGPNETAKQIITVMDMAGDGLEKIEITAENISITLKENPKSKPLNMPVTNNLWEHIQQLDALKEVSQDKDSLTVYVLRMLEELVKVANPRFFIMSPDSLLKKDERLWRYLRKGGMYSILFGMIVCDEPQLDEFSFVLCGGFGLGTEVTSIDKAVKGYLDVTGNTE